jgi:hypothetical protein
VEAKDSLELADKLRRSGVRAELLWLPGAGHLAPLVAMYRTSHHPTVLDAIRKFVGNTPADDDSAEASPAR